MPILFLKDDNLTLSYRRKRLYLFLQKPDCGPIPNLHKLTNFLGKYQALQAIIDNGESILSEEDNAKCFCNIDKYSMNKS